MPFFAAAGGSAAKTTKHRNYLIEFNTFDNLPLSQERPRS
jgi:hypothetical protein